MEKIKISELEFGKARLEKIKQDVLETIKGQEEVLVMTPDGMSFFGTLPTALTFYEILTEELLENASNCTIKLIKEAFNNGVNSYLNNKNKKTSNSLSRDELNEVEEFFKKIKSKFGD